MVPKSKEQEKGNIYRRQSAQLYNSFYNKIGARIKSWSPSGSTEKFDMAKNLSDTKKQISLENLV